MLRLFRRAAIPAVALSLTVLVVACGTLHPHDQDGCDSPDCPPAKAGLHPVRSTTDPTVIALAEDLDHLEKHIEWNGSVVAKVPDVWGQARLTQYRDEFEKAMAGDVNKFEFGLQGSLSRSDSAYLASAAALSFAAQPKPPVVGTISAAKGNAPALVPTGQTVQQVTKDPDTGATTTTSTTLAPPTPAAAPKAPDPVKPIELGDPAALVSGTDAVIGKRNDARLAEPLKFGQGGVAVGIEPAELLAQKKRYLDFLAQLRRENEGDDTADSPGYSLNLVRIPVSVLPGKKTDRGHGAEITMTLSPVLGDDLLPTTFRTLVQNDVVKHLGLPLTQLLGDKESEPLLQQSERENVIALFLVTPINATLRDENYTLDARVRMVVNYYKDLHAQDKRILANLAKGFDAPQRTWFEQLASGQIEKLLDSGLYSPGVWETLQKINAIIFDSTVGVRDKLKALQKLFESMSGDTKAKLGTVAKSLPKDERDSLEGMISGDLFRQALTAVETHDELTKLLAEKPSGSGENVAKLVQKLSKEAPTFTSRSYGKAMVAEPLSTRRKLFLGLDGEEVEKTAAKEWDDPKSFQLVVEAVDRGLQGAIADLSPANPVPVKELVGIRPTAEMRQIQIRLKRLNFAFSPGLENKTGFPVSQLTDVYGLVQTVTIAHGAYEALKDQIVRQKYAHLPDVQGYLQHEVAAAYRFLAEPECVPLWDKFCPRIATAVRTRRLDTLQNMQKEYRDDVEKLTLSTRPFRDTRPYNPQQQYEVTAALGWCILVDAALLTDRLQRDMKETASAKGQPLAGCDPGWPYYLPAPPRECRDAFNAYVKLRWPVHVFALDPYVQEQNIADSLSTRREMQLALAIAFTNGQISARTLTKYVRRLEAEYQTVALNRTQVGFTHGEDTFGWRFYPRFQTPDSKGNLEVFFREQLVGGRTKEQLLRDQRLEPGERECVAVVMMPAFVPYVTVDTASNWFALANPKHKSLDTTQAVKLSRAVRAITDAAPAVRDAACYRDGEDGRLRRRADQLAARLPLQTLTAPVPVLNTYGGFEMFSNGTTDLAPELYGWYGAPGLDPAAESTTLFLVGDHFSPLRTRVIVGNQAVDNTDPKAQTLLSRQVMQVTFKKGAYPLTDPKGQPATVRVHVATPYGVTRELDVPVVKQAPKGDPPPGFSFGEAKLVARYTLTPFQTAGGADAKLVVPAGNGSGNEKGLTITWAAPGGTLVKQVKVEFEFDYPPAAGLKLPCRCEVTGTVSGTKVEIPKEQVDVLADQLVGLIARVGPPFPRDANPLDKGLKTKKVTVTPVVDPKAAAAQGAETVDQLTVEFKLVPPCPPGGPCPPPATSPATAPPSVIPKITGEQPTPLHAPRVMEEKK